MAALHGGNPMSIGHQALPLAIGHQATPKQTLTISELPDSAKNEAGLRVLADYKSEIDNLKSFAYVSIFPTRHLFFFRFVLFIYKDSYILTSN